MNSSFSQYSLFFRSKTLVQFFLVFLSLPRMMKAKSFSRIKIFPKIKVIYLKLLAIVVMRL